MFNKKQLFFAVSKQLLRAGAVIFVAFLAIIFFSRQISKISRSIAEQRSLSSVLEKRNDTLAQLRKDFEVIDGFDAKIENAIPPVDNILDFVSSLEDLAETNSIDQTLSFESPVSSSINYGINLNGNIISLIKYLKSFEKLPYFTAISSINLSAPYGDWNGNSSVSLRAKVHTK
ncbi:hypothetical protein HY798_03170 [Candidatus Falkowbacteria bacterium]|nr:hypothetical protein [Candidatus Falkowbacteria bacterium]